MNMQAVSTVPFSHFVVVKLLCLLLSFRKKKKNAQVLYFQHGSDEELINNDYNTTYRLLWKIIFWS